ncbi:MAG: hypothetical protein QOE70_2608 [Chthoniobacter sp.]|jgi:hypothetical protein|nr:hypothetical protein [Chthoniobacter sp.]
MNADDAAALLPLYRAGRPIEKRIQKAVRMAEKDQALCEVLTLQMEFDEQIIDVIRSLQPPGNLGQKLREANARAPLPARKIPAQAFDPALLTAILGVLLIVGFVIWTVMERLEKFGGRDSVERMLSNTSKMTGVEWDVISTPAGGLGDWFYMRGFEGFTLPPEISALPAVGSRVLRQDGHPVAQLALDRHGSILHVFRASDFGIDLPVGESWRVLEYPPGWAGALRRQGDTCFLFAFFGTKEEMRQFLKSLKAP